MFGRMEPIVAMFALTGAQSDEYKKKLGAMTEAFKEQTEGINKAGFAWSQFTVKVSVLA